MHTITLAIGMFLLGIVAAYRCQPIQAYPLPSKPKAGTDDYLNEQAAEQEAEECPA